MQQAIGDDARFRSHRSRRVRPGRLWTRLVFLASLPARAAAASADPLEQLEREQEEVFRRAAPAVVLITREGGSGSGFFVTPDGLVLTNLHVVGGAGRVRVVLSDGRNLEGAVVDRAAEGVDLALVRVPVADAPILPLGGPGTLRVGAWAASVGHGGGTAWTFTAGMISNLRSLGNRPFIQVQMPLRPGASGGPLLDRQGRAVGVITAGTRDVEGISFAIPADAARAALGLLPGAAARAEESVPAERPTARREEWPPAEAAPTPRGGDGSPGPAAATHSHRGARLRAGFPDLEAPEAPGGPGWSPTSPSAQMSSNGAGSCRHRSVGVGTGAGSPWHDEVAVQGTTRACPRESGTSAADRGAHPYPR